MIPGSIVKIRLKGVEQMARAELRGLGDQDAIIVILTDSDLSKTFRQGLDEVKIGRASGGKIANIRIVRPLPEVDIVHEFWDDPVEVHIALPVGMRGEIDRDAIDTRGEIGAVIEIKAP